MTQVRRQRVQCFDAERDSRMRFVVLLLLGLFAGRAVAQPAPTFVVYFQEWSAALDDSAQGVITHAADFARSHPTVRVAVTGFADTTGSQKANALLSELRAQMVVDQLTADGIAADRIKDTGKGSVPAAFNKQEARRVQVTFSQP
ncbi:MAG: OmpA family protein [Acetobacteraceae bacterium]